MKNRSPSAPGASVTFEFELEQGERIDKVRYKDFFNDKHTTRKAPAY